MKNLPSGSEVISGGGGGQIDWWFDKPTFIFGK
jgi:hypothetical protein